MQPTWHILGPGAIGSLFACHLQRAGLPVVLIGRHANPSPASILLQEGDQTHHFSFEQDDGQRPITHLLITVKAHQTDAALRPIKHRLGAESLILLLQNGMGAWETVQQCCPEAVCLLATTTEGANRPAPGRVIHGGSGMTYIGALAPDLQACARQLCAQWSGLELNLQEDQAILRQLWQKLAINCAINPLTVIYDCPNGALLSNADALTTMENVCKEVETVMTHALGEPAPDLFELAKTVATRTGHNRCSMLQDVTCGRETEIDYITGFLLREAKRFNLNCPENQSLYDQISR